MFIKRDKLSKLIEARDKGDERASAIIQSFMNDSPDCYSLMEEYFKPHIEEKPSEPSEAIVEKVSEQKEEPKELSGLDKFLSDNGVSEGDENYDEYVEEYYNMFPDKKAEEPQKVEEPIASSVEQESPAERTDLDSFVKEETEGIGKYDKLIIEFTTMPGLSEAVRAGIVGKIQKIKEDELAHIAMLRDIADTINKKGE